MLGIYNAETIQILDEKLHLKVSSYHYILEAVPFFFLLEESAKLLHVTFCRGEDSYNILRNFCELVIIFLIMC